MKRLLYAPALAGLLFLTSCQQGDPNTYKADSAISMEKTVCFGFCPVYTVTIKGDGQATLEGERHLDKIGQFRKQLSPSETESLFRAFIEADFWSFEDKYTAEVTDLPTTFLSFTNQGRSKRIEDYHEAPESLKALEEKVAAIVATDGWERSGGEAPPDEHAQLIARGEYLVNVIGCHDCHSPKKMTEQGPVPDETRLLSGHPADLALAAYEPSVVKDWVLFNAHNTAVVGPWGVSFSSNLTSDDTGIGLWEREQFLRAMREGKAKGLENGRALLPPMPWPNFAQMTDEDLTAIYHYLLFDQAGPESGTDTHSAEDDLHALKIK